MTTIKSRQEKIIEEIENFDTELEQFDYFFDKAFSVEQRPRNDKYLIQGCLSKAWVNVYSKNEKIFMEVDSDWNPFKAASD